LRRGPICAIEPVRRPAVTAYAVAAGLFAAAGVFLIVACLVGATALFRWIELNYGLFQAFGAIGALLLATAAICAALAVSSVKRGAASISEPNQPLARRHCC
jgi:hypothetical protein